MAEPSEVERTLELLNDEVSDRLGRHRASTERIDTKALVVLGFTTTAAQFLASHSSVVWLTAPAYVIFAFAFFQGFRAYLPRDFYEVPEPPALVKSWSGRTRVEVLGALVGTKAHAFTENEKTAKLKVRYFRRSVVALVIALIVSSVSLVLGRSLDARPAGCHPPGGRTPARTAPAGSSRQPGPARPGQGECEADNRGDPNERRGTAP